MGGGSVFIYLKQQYPELKIWINDLNPELYFFWKIAQIDLEKMVEAVWKIKREYSDGKKLFQELIDVDVKELSELERAVRFFVLNRITFSGTVESGGFSSQAFERRFTDSSIERLSKLQSILPGIKITNLDYSDLLQSCDRNTCLFLDPPYVTATKSKLYGKRGQLHTNFNHDRFREELKQCNGNWLITYDDCQLIRDNFESFNIDKWKVQYGMNNYQKDNASRGKELLVYNYQLNPTSDRVYLQNARQLSLF